MTKDEIELFEMYLVQREALIAYMKIMIERGDWHGVSDAANDLRVLEAEYFGANKK